MRRNGQHYLEHIPVWVVLPIARPSVGAFQMFLQALFISPIAYDTWIHEPVVDIPGLPDLDEPPHLFEISHLEIGELVAKATALQHSLGTYVPTMPHTA